MAVVVAVVIFVLAYIVSTLVFMWAWDTVIVWLFHAPPLSFWQALAAIVIIAIVGGFFKSTHQK